MCKQKRMMKTMDWLHGAPTIRLFLGILICVFMLYVCILRMGQTYQSAYPYAFTEPEHISFSEYSNSRIEEKGTILDICDSNFLSNEKKAQNMKLKELGQLVQKRLHELQNPHNCSAKQRLILPAFQVGYGSQIHRLMAALSLAIYTNRTLLFDDSHFAYKQKGWSTFHQPLSDTCTHDHFISPVLINSLPNRSAFNKAEAVKLHVAPKEGLPGDMRDFHLIPFDIAQKLSVLHSRPHIWWMGQLVGYITRPSKQTLEFLHHNQKALNTTVFTVGLHVRRTDKNTEAAYQPLEKYMAFAENYLNMSRIRGAKNDIYLASEEPSLPEEFKKKYSWLEVHYTKTMIKNRYTADGLFSLIMDLYLLQHSNFIVCSMSSNVCRLLYELIQFNRGDASQCVLSVDNSYYSNDVGVIQKRKAIRDYTFTIPINGSINTYVNDVKELAQLMKNHAPCNVNQDFHRFPYTPTVTNRSLLVTPIKKGQLLELSEAMWAVIPPNFEFGYIRNADYRVCYPSEIAIDYIEK